MHARRQKLMNRLAMQAAAAASVSGRGAEHTITELVAYPVREPSGGRSYTVLRLRTNSGLTGWGECGRIAQRDLEQARQAVLKKPATSWGVIAARTALDGGLNMAMLDIAAKAVNAPVYRLLGGPTRFKARALTTLQGNTDAELVAAMRAAYGAGFRAFAVPLPQTQWRNQGQAFHFAVRHRMDALRSAQSGVDFVLAGNGQLTPGDAASIAAMTESMHPLWFDEPCPATNLATVRKISSETVVPLGFGRDVEASGFQDYLRQGIIDVLRPDIHVHGVSGIRQIGALAETYYTAMSPNHEGGPIATAAALHLAASLPNFFVQHVPAPRDERDRKMRGEIASPELERVQDGFFALPKGNGLGVEVNQAALERYKEGMA
jgi:galactonate dehydratase